MKTCPICRTQFDDSMRFCLEDGTPLVSTATDDSSETETLTRPTESKPTEATTEKFVVANPATTGEQEAKSASAATGGKKRGLALIAGAVGILVLIGSVGVSFWDFESGRSATPANNNQPVTGPANDLAGPAVGSISNISEPNSQINAAPKETSQPTPESTPTPKTTPEPAPPNKAAETPIPRPTRTEAPKTISAGVINNRATSLPTPDYPAAARRAGVSGRVNVQVLIDENGKVIRASAVSGHRLLRNSAVSAARRATFKPVQSGNRPARVTGIIVYNFRP